MGKQTLACTCNRITFSLKSREILTYATTWMSLQNTMLSGISQTHKDKCCRISLTGSPRVLGFTGQSRMAAAEGWQRGDKELMLSGYRVSVEEDDKFLDGDYGYTTV